MGVVEKVCRDIFRGEVNVTIGGRTHAFQEPSAIVPDGVDIHFLYGDLEYEEADNFDVPKFNAYDENLHEHLRRTARNPVSTTVIKVGCVERTPRNRWRSRVAV